MDTTAGSIVSIKANLATISVAAAGCPRCAAGRGCGAGLFSAATQPVLFEMPLEKGHDFNVGDAVTLSLASSTLVRAALFAYGLPLAGTILALLLGWLVLAPMNDLVAVMVAFAGLLAGFLAASYRLRGKSLQQQFVPSMTRGTHAITTRF